MKMNKVDEQSWQTRMERDMEIERERKKRERRLRNFTVIGIGGTIAIATFTMYFMFSTVSYNSAKTPLLEAKIELLSQRVSLQKIQISDLSKQISESPQSVDANINKIVEKLDSDYKKLQEIIIGNPANIIEFALLIREVDNLKESYKDHKESVYEEMGRNFGLFQWFIYMNIFIALAILGIAVTIYYQSKSIQETKDKGVIR